nr:hypothetical protein [Microbispora rosea]
MGDLVEDLLSDSRPDDMVIVHVLSHGEEGFGSVRVVGADGRSSSRSDLNSWLADASGLDEQEDDDATDGGLGGPTVLFLVDVCGGGQAARLAWQTAVADERRRAWVLAGCLPQRPGFNGWFTLAVANVLDGIAQGALDVHASLPFVPLPAVARAVRAEVNRLSAHGYGQLVVGTRVDIASELELPFFRNPGYRVEVDMRRRDRSDLRCELQEFWEALDELMDPWHFISRASGGVADPDERPLALFRGRHREMAALGAWLDGSGGPLQVVTGSPGVGKSSLLGMLVCATHPELADRTRYIYESRGDEMPLVNPDLAAIHARGRRLTDVVASLHRQLHLPHANEPTVEGLAEALIRRRRPGVIVLDALDEAIDAGGMMSELILPLAEIRRNDGSAACRILVGTRPWACLAPLLRRADRDGALLDLDTVPRAVLRDDLARYVGDLLRAYGTYASDQHRAARRAIAETVASVLASERLDDGQPRWGEFLVAGLFTNYLARHRKALEGAEAAAAAAAIPRTLPEVLDLDLRLRGVPGLREVLGTVAFARGDGMPRAVIEAGVSGGRSASASTEPEVDVGEALRQAGFYLRNGIDSEGVTVYRLFHQGLADYLRAGLHFGNGPGFAWEAEAVERATAFERSLLDRMLATVGFTPQGGGDWHTAEPYLLRHVADHAASVGRLDDLLADPEFLVHADSDALAGLLNAAGSADARAAAAVYRTSLQRQQRAHPASRRDVLAIDAMRHGQRRLASRLARPRSEAWPPLRPRWATAAQVSAAVRAVFTGHTQAITALACCTVSGRPVAVTASRDATARVWDLATGTCTSTLSGHQSWVNAVACVDLHGRPVAVTGGTDGTARVWDLSTGECTAVLEHPDVVTAVTYTEVGGRPIVVTGSTDGVARVWDLELGACTATYAGHASWVNAIACTVLNGRAVGVSGGHDGTHVWDLADGTGLGAMAAQSDTVNGICCASVHDQQVVITVSHDGTRTWALATGELLARPSESDRGNAVAHTVLDGRDVAVIGSNEGTVMVVDLQSGTVIAVLTGHVKRVTAVAFATVEGWPVAVTGGDDGTRIWDLSAVIGAPRPLGHGNLVRGVACAVVDGRAVVVTASHDHTARVWDLATGAPVLLLTGHGGRVNAVACAHRGADALAVTCGRDGTIRVWDLRTGAPGAVLEGHVGWANTVDCAVADDRVTVVSGGNDGTVRVWDPMTGTAVHTLAGHVGPVNSVACAVFDGRTVPYWSAAGRTTPFESGIPKLAPNCACLLATPPP